MDLIRELSLVQQSAAGAAGVVMLVIALVMMRRRSTATKKSADASTPRERRTRRRRAPKAVKAPRRRRKLASEAAEAMGTTSGLQPGAEIEIPIATPAAEISVPPVPTPPPAPVVVAEAPIEVEEQVTQIEERVAVGAAVAAAAVSDPYVSPVAQPGWPSPGELASGFDPDDFDPLPDAADDLPEPPEMIEAPAEPDAGEADSVAAGSSEDLWDDDDDFDPATGWAEDEGPGLADAPAIDVWTGDEADEEVIVDANADPTELAINSETIDLESLWDEADERSADSSKGLTEPFELPSEVVIDHEPALDHTPVSDEYTERAPVDIDADELPDFTLDSEPADAPMEWVEPDPAADAPGSPLSVPFPAPGTIPAHAVTGLVPATETSTGPILLDLASLASAGQTVEVVIEPGVDGNGVRLRIGAPAPVSPAPEPDAGVSDLPVSESVTAEADDPQALESVNLMDWAFTSDDTSAEPVAESEPLDAAVSAPVDAEIDDETFDVPFLTGGDSSFTAPSTAPGVVLPDFVDDEDATEASVETGCADEVGALETVDVSVTEVAAPMDDDLLDDPVQILADIRARLAALDARRGGV